jgi:hypothetical protein
MATGIGRKAPTHLIGGACASFIARKLQLELFWVYLWLRNPGPIGQSDSYRVASLSNSARSAPAIILCYLFRMDPAWLRPTLPLLSSADSKQGMKTMSICSTRRRIEPFRHRPPSFGDGRIVRSQLESSQRGWSSNVPQALPVSTQGGTGNHGTCDRLKITMPSTRRRVIGRDQVASVCLRPLPALLAALRVPLPASASAWSRRSESTFSVKM